MTLMTLQVELMRVDVETVSELSAGQTVCDVWHQSSKPKNVHVAQVSTSASAAACSVQAFGILLHLLIARMHVLNPVCPADTELQ